MVLDFGIPESAFSQYFTTTTPEGIRLTAREERLIRAVNPKRRLDFTLGRFCAKQALKIWGLNNIEILQGTHKEPIWPPGYVGSISHTLGMAGAITAKSSCFQSIGLDIEQIGRVKQHMWDMLFTPAEQTYIKTLPDYQQAFYTTLFFSMKESFYKLQFPLTNYAMWFTDVEIKEKNGMFKLKVIKEFNSKELLPKEIEIHYRLFQNFIISICCLNQ